MTRQEAAAIARSRIHRPTLSERFWSKVARRGPQECWPWLAAVRNPKDGYGAFWYEGRHRSAAHVAWMLDRGSLPKKGEQTCHKCDNPACVNPAHLFIGTNKDNNDDKVRKGRHVFGERSVSAKLTEADVLSIRATAQTGGGWGKSNIPQIAEKYGITRAHVYDIVNRACWRHVA